ncbi:hypothetical protein ACWT_4754 [Actinoplanes sp. SE50]|uniref:hypothetical protein n=1 Tax=unclassified Actinoplanes TaxID=2626549 RepID=UPI00023EC11B|nr:MULTISPECIES: hypothetical protein [unclassified Actinoplanes]AEV85775.1 hypothetical protein ACPL_4884 [Actinoplanes sp. SE50/110]ATO84169.1 hypothetical protein ACWT_4754 [Actinoplanes sp. SE50]SLM01579.1 hypothetical protein ACSP50_4815 [Actinoplanes sp. SE50/110]
MPAGDPSFGRQLLLALARSTPAFHPAREARRADSTLLDAVARRTPAFTGDQPHPDPVPFRGTFAFARPTMARRGSRSLAPLLAGLATVLFAAVGSAVLVAGAGGHQPTLPLPGLTDATGTATTGGPPPDASASPTGSAAAQGAAMNQLLDRSSASRAELNAAIIAVLACEKVDDAVSRLQAVGVERDEQRSTLASLDLSAIPSGEAARDALSAGLTHSLNSDVAYVKWARERNSAGCADTPAAKVYRQAADHESASSAVAKEQFLALWNPIAVSLGLPSRGRQDL